MKRMTLLLIMLVVVMTVFARPVTKLPNAIPNKLLICFDAKAINSIHGDIKIDKIDTGQIQIGIPSFDAIASKYGIMDIERHFDHVGDPQWHSEKGAYLSNIFAIYFKDNDLVHPALEELTEEKSLIWAEYDVVLKQSFIPNDPRFNQQWYHSAINTIDVWDYINNTEFLHTFDEGAPVGQQSKEIVIAIVDSGVKWNHPDLWANIWINEAEMDDSIEINMETGEVIGGNGVDDDRNGKIDDVLGWSFYTLTGWGVPTPVYQNNQSYQSYAGNTHGTHVAGCAGAVGNNQIGVTGSAMKVKLLPLRCGSVTEYSEHVTGASDAVRYAADLGRDKDLVMIINCSFSGPGEGQTWTDTVNYAISQGAVVVVAAGNDPWDIATGETGQGEWPSNVPAAITVSAFQSNGTPTTWTSYGNNVDITSPGQDIMNTYYGGSGLGATDSYQSISGTSMATPITSGVIAQLLSVHGQLPASQVSDRIRATGKPIPNNNLYNAGKLGGGLLDAFKFIFYDLVPDIGLADEVTVVEAIGNGDGVIQFGETVTITATLQNDINWITARNATVQLVSNQPGINVTSTNPVSIGNISPGASSSAFSFTVELGLGINSLNIPCRFIVRSNQGAESPYPYSKEVPFTFQASISKPNWPFLITGTANVPPIVHDFGQGKRLVTLIGSNLYLIDAENEIQAGFPVNSGGTSAKIAIGNVNGGATDEIVLATSGSSPVIKVFDSSGNMLYDRAFTSGNAVRSSIVIADINNDGQNEIIFATQQSRNIYILNGHDLTDFTPPITMDSTMLTNLAVGDLNNDNIKEIVVMTSLTVCAYNPITGNLLSGFPVVLNTTSTNGPTIADLDGGGDYEIIVGSTDNSECGLFVIKNNGTIFSQTTLNSGIPTEIAAICLAGDGEVQIAFGTRNGNFYLKSKWLTNAPGFPVNIGNNVSTSSPVFADMDGDGVLEIIFGDSIGYLHVLKKNGSYLSGFPIKVTNSEISMSPWVGNFTPNANFADILLPISGGIDFINTRRTLNITQHSSWNQYRGNIANTAFNSYHTTAENNLVNVPVENTLEQNYPNPFNPTTTIQFSIDKIQQTKLSVYNIKGQLVKTLVDKNLPAGSHSIVWNGLDDANQPVSSGIYFYRLLTDGHSQTKKMLLMK